MRPTCSLVSPVNLSSKSPSTLQSWILPVWSLVRVMVSFGPNFTSPLWSGRQ